jgi:hypothetical protein
MPVSEAGAKTTRSFSALMTRLFNGLVPCTILFSSGRSIPTIFAHCI